MKKAVLAAMAILAMGAGVNAAGGGLDKPVAPASPAAEAPGPVSQTVILPPPRMDGPVSLEACLARRRSVRGYAGRDLTWEEIGQLLWAAQGVTAEGDRRTAPSAGALYPLEVYVATRQGVHHYVAPGHRLVALVTEDRRAALRAASLNQPCVGSAPAVFVIAAVVARTAGKYGDRAARYVHIEAGHAAQNLLLQAAALDLAGVPIGAFDDAGLQRVLGLPADQAPLYVIPVGEP